MLFSFEGLKALRYYIKNREARLSVIEFFD